MKFDYELLSDASVCLTGYKGDSDPEELIIPKSMETLIKSHFLNNKQTDNYNSFKLL